MKNQQIKVNLEADIKQWLESQAAERHCSVSQKPSRLKQELVGEHLCTPKG